MHRYTLCCLLALAVVPALPARSAPPVKAPSGPCDTLSGMPPEQDYLDIVTPPKTARTVGPLVTPAMLAASGVASERRGRR